MEDPVPDQVLSVAEQATLVRRALAVSQDPVGALKARVKLLRAAGWSMDEIVEEIFVDSRDRGGSGASSPSSRRAVASVVALIQGERIDAVATRFGWTREKLVELRRAFFEGGHEAVARTLGT